MKAYNMRIGELPSTILPIVVQSILHLFDTVRPLDKLVGNHHLRLKSRMKRAPNKN
jgi:hypothetical protein